MARRSGGHTRIHVGNGELQKVREFLKARTVEMPEKYVSRQELWHAWLGWCHSEGLGPQWWWSQTRFTRVLTENFSHELEQERWQNVTYWTGVGLRESRRSPRGEEGTGVQDVAAMAVPPE